jgi:hypothetical protein
VKEDTLLHLHGLYPVLKKHGFSCFGGLLRREAASGGGGAGRHFRFHLARPPHMMVLRGHSLSKAILIRSLNRLALSLLAIF